LAEVLAVAHLTVRSLNSPGSVPAREYLAFLGDDKRALPGYAADRIFPRLAAAYLAQRNGHGRQVRPFIPRLEMEVHALSSPRAEEMLGLVRATDMRLSGDVAGAIAELTKRTGDGVLFQTHVALRDA
jgi:hypothetical protein